jgi:hypothetical protein
LEDVNDNAPFIYPTVAEVCDDAKNLSVVILGASDMDLHPNTDPFKFEIHKPTVPDKVWKISKINSTSALNTCPPSSAFSPLTRVLSWFLLLMHCKIMRVFLLANAYNL